MGQESDKRALDRLQQRLEEESRRAFDLQQECFRLQGELGRLRTDFDEVRRALRLLFASWTWRSGALLNSLASRALLRRRVPTAKDYLEDVLGLNNAAVEEVLKIAQEATYRALTTADHFLFRTDGGLLGPGSIDPRLQVGIAGNVRVALPEPLQAVKLSGPRSLRDLALDCVMLSAEDPELDTWLAALDQARVGVAIVGHVLDDLPASGLRPAVLPAADDLELRRVLLASHALRGHWSPPLFDFPYLSQNPDVRRSVARREITSAGAHWEKTGRNEFLQGWRTYRPFVGRVDMGLRERDPELAERARGEMADWRWQPKISIVVPIYKVELRWLKAAVESVTNQIYGIWELCLVDDASGSQEITDYLGGLEDERIKVRLLSENAGIAAASNAALEMATGDYVALLDHDDELTLDALWLVARVIVQREPDLIYSDEAKLDLDGNVVEPHFKPCFSPEMVQSQNYISHLGVYRRSLLQDIGGFRLGYEGSQDHDMLLRFLLKARSVFHIPRILYYWRKVPQSTAARFGSKSHAWDAGVRAVQDVQEALGTGATVEKGQYPGTYRVRHPIQGRPKVSILVPFRDQPDLLNQCFGSLLEKTRYRHFELFGIDNQSQEEGTRLARRRWEAAGSRVRFLDYDDEFNFSAINNFGVEQATGDHVLLLNNDVEIIDGDWLEALLEFSQQPGVGAVGGRLLYPDDTLQHAGVILGIGGVAGHSHKYFPANHHGYFCRPHLIQNVSAVTGACLMVKRELYMHSGGLDDRNLKIAFNDIDFCLRLLELGYRNVYTPYCTLYHHESKSRGQEDTDEKRKRFAGEASYMKRRHLKRLSLGDRWYNPNLTLDRENFEVREVVV